MQYTYDNTGVYFCYFLLSLLGLWLVPTTYFYVAALFGHGKKAQGEQPNFS
jgi:preprotein translocase subunit Sec63